MNPNKSIVILSFVLLFAGLQVQAQEKAYEPKGSFSVDVGIPALGQNYSFKRIMEGLFNGGVTYQYNLFKGITVGAGAKYSFFDMNTFALNNADWRGGLHMPAGYLRLAYEKFTTERVSLSAGMKIGYSYMISANDSCKTAMGKPYTYGTFFMEPQIEALMLTGKSDAGGFSFVLGYNFYFADFGPEYLCMDEFPNLSEEDYKGITRFLSIGFGYRYYFGRK